MSANGYLAASELAPIGDGLFLRTDAAASFLAMAADARADDVEINSPGIAGAYRPWAMQVDMRVHPALYGINPYMHALPGLPSSHGTGLARDVPFGAPNNWMIANAARYDWTRPERTLRFNDLNHWEYTPGTATASLDATPISITTDTETEDDMAKTTGIYYTRAADGAEVFALINPVSGFYSEWTLGPNADSGSYNNPIAAGFDTGSFVPVTESHAAALKAAAAAVHH